MSDANNDNKNLVSFVETNRLKISVLQKSENLFVFEAYDKDNKSFVGSAQVKTSTRPFGRVGLISYEVSELKRGRGYATELLRNVTCYAYKELSLVSLYGVAPENNLAAQYVLKRTGFVFNDICETGQYRYETWNPQFRTETV